MIFEELRKRALGGRRLPTAISFARARGAPTASSEVFAAAPGCVTALALEPLEERVLVAVDTRACVRVFDCDAPRARALRATVSDADRAHARAITSITWYSRDGGIFVTGGADGRVVAWDARAGGGPRPALRVDVLEGGVVSSSRAGALRTVVSGDRRGAGFSGGGAAWGVGSATAEVTGRVHCVSMSPCAGTHALVACGTKSPAVRLVDLATGAATHSLPGARDAVLAVAWAPHAEFVLAAGSRDGSIRLFDIRRAGSSATLAQLDRHTSAAEFGSLASGRSSRSAPALTSTAAASLGVTFRERSSAITGAAAAQAATAAQCTAHGEGGVNGLVWVPRRARAADATLLSSGADGVLRAWGVAAVPEREGCDDPSDLILGRASGAAAWNTFRDFPGIRNRARRCTQFAVASSGVAGDALVIFHGGGGDVAAGAADVGAVGAWDAATGTPLGTLRAHAANVNAIVWRRTLGGELYTAGDDGVICRWVKRP